MSSEIQETRLSCARLGGTIAPWTSIKIDEIYENLGGWSLPTRVQRTTVKEIVGTLSRKARTAASGTTRRLIIREKNARSSPLPVRVLLLQDVVSDCYGLREVLDQIASRVDFVNVDVTTYVPEEPKTLALVVLDVAATGAARLEIIHRIKRVIPAPLLVMTQRDRVTDRLAEVGLGVDAHLVKPVTVSTLLAQIHHIASSAKGWSNPLLRMADLEVNQQSRMCTRSLIDLNLSDMEFEILLALIQHRGRVLPHAQLIEQVWGVGADDVAGSVRVGIRRLRAKLDDPFERKLLHTVRGKGYVLTEASWT